MAELTVRPKIDKYPFDEKFLWTLRRGTLVWMVLRLGKILAADKRRQVIEN